MVHPAKFERVLKTSLNGLGRPECPVLPGGLGVRSRNLDRLVHRISVLTL